MPTPPRTLPTAAASGTFKLGDLTVHRMGFGAMRITGEGIWGEPLSNVSVEQLRAARRIVPIVSVQNRYNLTDRHSDDVLAGCAREGLGFMPYLPLGANALTGSASPLVRAAQHHGVTPGQLALAWLLHRSPVMLPIPGTSSVQHLEENVAAASVKLSADALRALEQR